MCSRSISVHLPREITLHIISTGAEREWMNGEEKTIFRFILSPSAGGAAYSMCVYPVREVHLKGKTSGKISDDFPCRWDCFVKVRGRILLQVPKGLRVVLLNCSIT